MSNLVQPPSDSLLVVRLQYPWTFTLPCIEMFCRLYIQKTELLLPQIYIWLSPIIWQYPVLGCQPLNCVVNVFLLIISQQLRCYYNLHLLLLLGGHWYVTLYEEPLAFLIEVSAFCVFRFGIFQVDLLIHVVWHYKYMCQIFWNGCKPFTFQCDSYWMEFCIAVDCPNSIGPCNSTLSFICNW